MNRKRLMILARKLERVPGAKFDLRYWANNLDFADPNRCGTTGCAVGWACVIPSFNRDGLALKQERLGPQPAFDEHRGWAAVKEFFGLNDTEANYLFARRNYSIEHHRDPQVVARRIRDFVAQGGLPSCAPSAS